MPETTDKIKFYIGDVRDLNYVNMGDFYCVSADNRGINLDKFFEQDDAEWNTSIEFNSNNTKILFVEETKMKIDELIDIFEELEKKYL